MVGLSARNATAAAAAVLLAATGVVQTNASASSTHRDASAGADLGSASAAATARRRWDLTFRDDFRGRRLDRRHWAVYSGGDRRSENAFVRNGKLVLRTKRTRSGWTAAGVSNSRACKLTYGRYVIRARMDKGYGVRAAALLWPTGGVWPPEVDFFEVDAVDAHRRTNKLTNHYGATNQMTHREYKGDLTRWHRIGVIWTPRALRFTFDGRVMRAIRHHVPQRDMWLGLQSAIGGISARAGARTPSVVDFEVDWVKIHRYLGRRGRPR
jgi:beta-glucanase (GH16 family)